MHETHVDLIQRICKLIDQADEPLTLADLGAAVDVSPGHLQRLFKRIMGISPRQYADARRLGRFKTRLQEQTTVTTALHEAGYGSTSRIYERAAGHLGMTPGVYRQGGKAVAVGYTLVDCPLGRLLLAGTEKGVCAVYLGDADEPLERELNREFPAAVLSRDDAGLRGWVEAVREHLQGDLPHLDLPLDVRATAFQWRVWQQLRAIPRGQTRTYGQIAEAMGQPTGARAVAQACAANPVSVIVPCHRVVRGDGGLGGYRWGLDRKQKLLDKEKDSPAE